MVSPFRRLMRRTPGSAQVTESPEPEWRPGHDAARWPEPLPGKALTVLDETRFVAAARSAAS